MKKSTQQTRPMTPTKESQRPLGDQQQSAPTSKWDEKSVKKMLEEAVEDSQDALKIFKSQNLSSVIEDTVLDENEKKLVPLVLLGRIQKRLEKEAKKKEAYSKLKGGSKDDELKDKLDGKEEAQSSGGPSFEQAYRNLVAKQPKGELEIKIRRYILDNIPREFARSFTPSPSKIEGEQDIEGNLENKLEMVSLA